VKNIFIKRDKNANKNTNREPLINEALYRTANFVSAILALVADIGLTLEAS